MHDGSLGRDAECLTTVPPYAPYPLNLLRDWLYRNRWWVRLALVVVLVPYLGYFAYTRITTPSAGEPWDPWAPDPGVALNIPDPAVDVTKQLMAAIATLPTEPALTPPTTAPEGAMWVTGAEYFAIQTGHLSGDDLPPRPSWSSSQVFFDAEIALSGPWIPESRYHMAAVLDYLDDPATAAALADVAKVSGRPFCITNSLAGDYGRTFLRNLARLFTARARYHLAGHHDLDSAIRDLEVVLQLAAGVEDDQEFASTLTGIACRDLALHELMCWTQEFSLSPAQTARLDQLLQRYPVDGRRSWNGMARGKLASLHDHLDRIYTIGDDGWVVVVDPRIISSDENALLAGNLLAPLFETRHEAAVRLAGLEEALLLPDGLTYSQMIGRVSGACPVGYDEWSTHLPPTSEVVRLLVDSGLGTWAYVYCNRTSARQRGARIVLALSAYHSEHGTYPENLAKLVPDYLESLPQDPFGDAPFRYRLESDEDYLLYSVFENGVDDHGVTRSSYLESDELPDWPDWPVRASREGLEFLSIEWVLVSDPAVSSADIPRGLEE